MWTVFLINITHRDKNTLSSRMRCCYSTPQRNRFNACLLKTTTILKNNWKCYTGPRKEGWNFKKIKRSTLDQITFRDCSWLLYYVWKSKKHSFVWDLVVYSYFTNYYLTELFALKNYFFVYCQTNKFTSLTIKRAQIERLTK